jgi:diguanylate cyclase (GGDEF)-like protein
MKGWISAMTDNTAKFPLPDFHNFLQSIPDLYLLLNPKFEIVAVSDAYLHATMVKREEIIGRGIFDIFPDNPNDLKATGVTNLRSSLNRVLKNKAPDAMAVQKYDIRRPAAEGGGFEERYWSPLNSPILDKDNQVIYIIHRAEDVTEFIRLKNIETEHKQHLVKMEFEIFQRAQEIQATNKKLENLASYDDLTGLANRNQLTNKIKKYLSSAKENNSSFAVIFLDIDQFKLINDTLGHKTGDVLLQIIGKRLAYNVKESDIVARMGGDEFIILLNEITTISEVTRIIEKILIEIKKEISIDNHKLYMSASIGISLFPQNGQDEITLLKHADIAMYRAKQLGRNGYQFYP